MRTEEAFWFYPQKTKPKKTNITLTVDSLVVEELRKDADLLGLSLNAKVNNVLSKHVSFYRHTEKQECLIMPQSVWGTLIGLVDEQKLKVLLEQEVSSHYTMLLHNNIPLTLENCIKYCFEGICMWSGMYCTFRKYPEGTHMALIFEHKFGIKWSRLLGDALVNLIGMVQRRAEAQAHSNTIKIIVDVV